MPCYIAQSCHLVNALPPVDINGGVNTDIWSMKGHSHASIIISMGVTGAASTVTLQECDDFTPSSSAAIAFDYYSETTDSGDTLGAKTSATASGFATSTNNNIMYVIEVDASQLSAGFPCLRVCFSDPSAATFATVQVVLSGSRYGGDQNATAIA